MSAAVVDRFDLSDAPAHAPFHRIEQVLDPQEEHDQVQKRIPPAIWVRSLHRHLSHTQM